MTNAFKLPEITFPEITFPEFIFPEIESETSKFKKFRNHTHRMRDNYNNKRQSTTKNFKRYNQFQPRNRGTNHTLMRKGNTW